MAIKAARQKHHWTAADDVVLEAALVLADGLAGHMRLRRRPHVWAGGGFSFHMPGPEGIR